MGSVAADDQEQNGVGLFTCLGCSYTIRLLAKIQVIHTSRYSAATFDLSDVTVILY